MLGRVARIFHKGPGSGADRLIAEHVLHLKNVLPSDRAACIRSLVETKLGGTPGDNFVFALSDKRDDRYIVDPSVILHLLRSPVLGLLKEYFRKRNGTEEMVMPIRNLLVRRFDPLNADCESISIPFHQDALGLPPTLRMVNCWTLLSPDECGSTSPGLEFIPGRFRHVLRTDDHPNSKHYGFLEASHEAIARLVAKRGTWRPSIHLADVVIFDEMIPHRTYLHRNHFRARISAELRFLGYTNIVKRHFRIYPQPLFFISGDFVTGPSVVCCRENSALSTVTKETWSLV